MQTVDVTNPESDPTIDQGADTLLGRVFVDQGIIDEDDIEIIVKHARQKRLRFGEAARELKLISKEDLERAMAKQFNNPFLAEGEGGYPVELVAAFKPFSKKGQAIHKLRACLLQHWNSVEHRSLAVVGSSTHQGCSYIAANLAITFSQLGQRTLLVDADMQNAHLHQLFNINNNVGLSAVLAGRTSINFVAKKLPFFRNLSIVSAGAPPPNATELLGRKELNNVMMKLRKHFEIVIFDTPPLDSNSGAELIARACGDSIVVLRKDFTIIEDAKVLVDALRENKSDIIGAVMTNY